METLAEEHLREGLGLAIKGDTEKAEYFLLNSYELLANEKIASALGWFYGVRLNRPMDGFRYFRRAVRYKPESGDLYNECGNILFRNGHWKESLKWFHRAHLCQEISRPDYVLYNLAIVYHKLNRPERSRRYLRLALRQNPRFNQAKALLDRLQSETPPRAPDTSEIGA